MKALRDKMIRELAAVSLVEDTVRNKEGFGDATANFINERSTVQSANAAKLNAMWLEKTNHKSDVIDKLHSNQELQSACNEHGLELSTLRTETDKLYKHFQTKVMAEFRKLKR